MLAVAAVVSFAISWILWLAKVHDSAFLTWQSFMLIGLVLLAAAHIAATGWPWARPASSR